MRKRFKIPLFAVVLFIIVLAAAVFWALRSGWVLNRAEQLANSFLGRTTSIHVEVGDLSGDVFNDLAAEHVVVTAGPNRDTLAIIGRIAAEYDFGNIWRRQWIINRVRVESPHLFLPRDSAVTYLRALLPGKRQEEFLSESPVALSLRSVLLNDGVVYQREDSTIVLDSINVHLAFAQTDSGVSIDVRSASLRDPRLGHVDARGKYATSETGWRVDSLHVKTDRTLLDATGTNVEWNVHTAPLDFDDLGIIVKGMPTGVITFDGTVTPPNRPTWSAYGVASGAIDRFDLDSVTVGFTLDGSEVTFESISGIVSDAYWNGSGALDVGSHPEHFSYEGSVRHFNLAKWVQGSFTTDLSGRVRADGSGLTEADFALNLDVDLTPGHFDHVQFDAATGSALVTSDEIIFEDNFDLFWDENRFIGGGMIGYTDSMDVFGNIYSNDLRSFESLLGLDSLGGRCNGYIYIFGATQDPDLAGRLQSDSLVLAGILTRGLDASIFVPQFLTQRAGTITADMGSTSISGIETDSIHVRAEISGESMIFDSISIASPVFKIRGQGSLDWSGPIIPIKFYPVDVIWEDQSFAARDTMSLIVDSLGVELTSMYVQSSLGEMQAKGRYGFDESLDFILSVDSVPIGPTWQRFRPGENVGGKLGCTAHIAGTLTEPVVDFDGIFTGLRYEGLWIGNLSGTLTYKSHQLRTDRLVLNRRNLEIVFSGVLPLDFQISPPKINVRDTPLSGNLTATGESFPIGYFLPETVESLEGPFSVTAELSGTLRSPRVSGNAFLRAGRIKAVEIINPIEDVNADIVFHQDTIEVKRATGVVRDNKKKGTITADGTLRILEYNVFNYNLHVKGRNVPARFEFEDYYVESNFDLDVTGITPPLVSGTISPSRVEDRTPFDDEPTAIIIDPKVWDWDLSIEMPGNYWIHNDQIDAEMSADIRLLRDKGEITYLGTADFIRGQVYLFDKTGRISRGTLTFNSVNEPDPDLDIDVTFRIRQPRPEDAFATEGTQVVQLNLHVGGKASEPLIDPVNAAGETALTEQDVILLLTANTTFSGTTSNNTIGGDPWANRLKFAATGLLFSEVQRVAARKLGLETLEINSGEDVTQTEITVGRYFTPRLYLYGTSPVDVAAGQEVGFEYRFNRHVFLEGNRDRQNLYRLNIHFNWDY